MSSMDGILIADSGSIAKYNIESLEQMHALGHSIVRSSFANKFDLVISEPDGNTFFDLIRTAGLQQGIRNHLQAVYLIEISFPGRDENNTPRVHRNVFRYLVKFVSVVAEINAGGSKYTIAAVELATTAYAYLAGVIKRTITIEAATVGEAITELEKKINEAEEADFYTDPNSSAYNRYSFDFDASTTAWRAWRIENADGNAASRNESTVGDKIQFTFTIGSNLHDVFGIILRSTNEYKRMPTFDGGFSRSDGHLPSESGSDKLNVFYKIIPFIEHTGFDFLKNDYTKHITFRLKRHIVPNFIVDAGEYQRSINDPGTQSAMYRNLSSTGLLRKRYDYIFTGANTEVINLDIKLEMLYYLLSTNHGGQVLHNRLANNVQGNPRNIINQIRSAKQRIVQSVRAENNIQQLLSAGESNFARTLRLQNPLGNIGLLRTELDNLLEKANLSGIDLGVTFHTGNVDDAYHHSPENDTVESANLQHATAIANLENSSDLLTIELNIRGDPYWLGQPNSFYREANSNFDVADYELGGVCFFLKVNMPVEEDANGRRIPRPDFTITGIYQVINVITQYRSGQFIQFLKAVRIKTMNTSSILGTIDTDGDAPRDGFVTPGNTANF